MKAKICSSFLTVTAVLTALCVVYMFGSRASKLAFSRHTEVRFPRTSVPTYSNPSPSLPRITKPTFTCEQSNATIVDSFGTPCINFSKTLLKRQNIYVHASKHLSYVYCGIPKNGCTYHVGLMHRLMGYPYEGGGNVHSEENKDRLFAPSTVTHLLQSETVPKYAVIRNPMHRVLSAYLNKVESQYQHDDQKTPESFHKWIYEKEAMEPGMDWTGRNPHWVPQLEFCGFKVRDLSTYFRIFRVEEPATYVEYIESFLPESVLKDGWDMPRNKSFRQHVLGPRSRTENTTARFLQYMGSLQVFDHLRQVYSEDVDVLGYKDEVNELREKLVEYLEVNK